MFSMSTNRFWQKLKAFRQDDSGAMTILAIVFFVVLIGLGGLVIDIGRLYSLHTQVQSYADHVALAAANNLDKKSNAVIKAVRTAIGDGVGGPVLSDHPNFADSQSDFVVQKMVFLEELGPDPLPDAITPAPGDIVVCTFEAGAYTFEAGEDAASCNATADVVEVTVVPRTQTYFLLPLVDIIGRLAGAGPIVSGTTTTARATAEFVGTICTIPPLMFCNPYETATNKEFTPVHGQQIMVKTKGPSSSWGPGVFGLVNPPSTAGAGKCTGGGANFLRCILGLVNPNAFCVDDSVDVKPGQAVAVHTGLNVRFDIWDPPLHNKDSDNDFAPSQNVMKGRSHMPNQCSENKLNPSSDTVALPRDQCLIDGNCGLAPTPENPEQNPRFGDIVTEAQLATYWTTNHLTPLPGPLTTASLGRTPSRFDVYRYELDNNKYTRLTDPKDEESEAHCASSTPINPSNPAADRRIMTIAVINCDESGVTTGGNKDDVPVIDFAQMFFTEYITGGSSEDIYMEMLKVDIPKPPRKEFPVLRR